MKLLVVLDKIRSAHNVGSIFRTADAVGVEKVYCCGITPAPLDRFKNVRTDFAKVSLGAEKSVAWESAAKTEDVLSMLKKDAWQIFAVEQAKGSIPYYEADATGGDGLRNHKIALVLGNEVDGLQLSLLKLADKILEIPMRGKKESLNVAVAFGIVAFEIVLQSKK